MTKFAFDVMGSPIPQPRPRACTQTLGLKTVARVYDNGRADPWKFRIAMAAREVNLRGAMIQVPVLFRMACHFQRPNSHFGAGKNASKLKPSAPFWHTARPDLDNLVKAAKDAITDIGGWRDDSLVVQEFLLKRYVDGRGAPFTHFEIVEVSA